MPFFVKNGSGKVVSRKTRPSEGASPGFVWFGPFTTRAEVYQWKRSNGYEVPSIDPRMAEREKEIKIELRKTWRPRYPEASQCASCPFGEDNDDALLNRLEQIFPSLGHVADPASVRLKVRQDVAVTGNFVCHQTVWDGRGAKKPESAHRQCAGAAKFFRSGEEP